MANKFKSGDYVKFVWPPTVPRNQWAVAIQQSDVRALPDTDRWFAGTPSAQNGVIDQGVYGGTLYRIIDATNRHFVHWCDETWLQADTYAATMAGVLSAAKTFSLPSAPPPISGGTVVNPTGKFKAGDQVTIKRPPLLNHGVAAAFAKVSAPFQAKHLAECEANAGLFGNVVHEDSLGMLCVSMPGAPHQVVWADPSWLENAVKNAPPTGWPAPGWLTSPPQKIWKFTVGETEQRFDFTPAAPKDRDFDGFCDRATYPDFVGWCGGHRFHRIGCPQTRSAVKK